MYRIVILVFLLPLVAACSTTPGQTVTADGTVADAAGEVFVDFAVPDAAPEVNAETHNEPETWVFVTGPDVPFVECAPGDGCFLDPCRENEECQSGWCVEHMGDGVCTQLCTEECPPGWSCKPVSSGGPDLTYVCVSAHANLCRPCSTGADCKGVGGTEDVCLNYDDEGSFCGGTCATNDDCPWGFSCLTTVTVDGVSTLQCVADAGVCPCTAKSVALSLFTPCAVTNDFGTCTGKRFCSEDGLTECDSGTPQPEECDGFDEDCDGSIDEPNEFEGNFLPLCDDDNPCTDDACLGAEGCSYTPLTEGECLDGDACTIGDHCEAGVCLGAPIDCDDEDPCTDDICDGLGGCDFLSNHASCDDGDPCTVSDGCEESICSGYAVACDCTGDADCAPLDDGDLCTGSLFCNQDELPYKCQVDPATVVTCEPPQGLDAFCLASLCNPDSGQCETVPAHEGFACNDADSCTVGETCQEGTCNGVFPANCNDGNLCTDDSCDPGLGCQHEDNALACQDADACTIGDHCEGGGCVPGALANCDDKNPCTDDGCDMLTGCTHDDNADACNDGNACTTGDHCSAGACMGDATLDCDDKNPCTDDACTPGGGCQHVDNEAPCSDQNACTLNDSCVGGLCKPGPSLACNDGNLCTDDSCDQTLGCLYEANALPCDDGNACTLSDACDGGTCQSSVAFKCDDDNVCTTDQCSPDQGCVHALNTAPCDDDDLCTTKDQCQLGECIGSEPLVCNDNNPCTNDSCGPDTGCSFTPNLADCDDGDACTSGDGCSDGWCKGTTLVCTDDNLCTDDICDPESGCQFIPNTVPCDDSDACTSSDACGEGECKGAEPVNCNDNNLCTDDSCAPESGCVNANNSVPCNDQNACTTTDTCAGGDCVGAGALPCDDSDSCTTDSCDPEQGCLNAAITPCCGNGSKDGAEECDGDDDAACPGKCEDNCKCGSVSIHNTVAFVPSGTSGGCSYSGSHAVKWLNAGNMSWKACAVEASKRGAMMHSSQYTVVGGWYSHRKGTEAMTGKWNSYQKASIGSSRTCILARDPHANQNNSALNNTIKYDGWTWRYQDFGNKYYDQCQTLAGNAGAMIITPYTIGQSGDGYWINSVHMCNTYQWIISSGNNFSHDDIGSGQRSSVRKCMVGYVDQAQ